MKRLSIVCIFLLFCCSTSTFAKEEDFVLSVGEIPNPEHLVFAKAMAEVFKEMYPQRVIKVVSYPFARSINNVLSGEADAHMPLLRVEEVKNLEFAYSTRSYSKVVLVIYSNKENIIDKTKLLAASYQLSREKLTKVDPRVAGKLAPLLTKSFSSKEELQTNLRKVLSPEEFSRVGPDLIQLSYQYEIGSLLLGPDIFPFPTHPGKSIEAAMKMIDAGRLAGGIFTQDRSDELIRMLHLKNVRRRLYGVLPVHFVIAKTEKGRKADETLSKVLDEMEKRGVLKKLSKSIHERDDYVDWQPK